MTTTEIEEVLKEIRKREDYLVTLKEGKELEVCYYWSPGGLVAFGGHYRFVFSLNHEEKEFLKASCIARIKELRKSIECLTDE